MTMMLIRSAITSTLLCATLFARDATAGHPQAPDLFERGYQDYKMIRERDNVVYNYEPQWIDEALCGTIDEQQCQEMDEAFGQEVQKKMNIIKQVNNRRNNRDGRELQSEIEPFGSFKVLVLLMRWQEHDEVDIVAREDYDRMFNADPDDVGSTVIPTGSVRRYFEVSSYDKLTFEATVIDWMTTDNTETFYAGTNTGRSPSIQQSLVPLLESLDNSGFNFDDVDANNDKLIDLVVVLHSGYASEEGGVDLRFGLNTLPENRIQSHSTAATATSLTWRSRDNHRVGQYLFASAFRQTSGANIARLGVPTHEMFHNFGLPDLYDNDGKYDPTSGDIGGIDRFGLMANPAGQRNNKARCGHLSAWSKEQLGFAIPTVITTDGTYSTRPVELFPEIYRINLSPTEYLLIEHRVPIPGDFDEFFWGNGGIVIYKIDGARTNPPAGQFPGNNRRGFPGQAGWPGNGNHYAVAVLQADSIGTPGGRDGYELEQTINGGEEEDLWLSSTQVLGPGTAETIANNDIFPNTDLYGDSGIRTSGVAVSNFRIMDGAEPRTMLFDVSGLLQDGTPTENPTPNPTFSPTLTPTVAPVTESPTGEPTGFPLTANPTVPPSKSPSFSPSVTAATENPTETPQITENPTPVPTNSPTEPVASMSPTQEVTISPTGMQSFNPTGADDSNAPTGSPSLSNSPTETAPSAPPTSSSAPSVDMSSSPSAQSAAPSIAPTIVDSQVPSQAPSGRVTTSAEPTMGSNSPSELLVSAAPSMVPTTISPVGSPTRPPALAPPPAGGIEVVRRFGPIFPPSAPPDATSMPIATPIPMATPMPIATPLRSKTRSSRSRSSGKGKGKGGSSSSSTSSRSSSGRRLQRSAQITKLSINDGSHEARHRSQ